MPDIGPNNLNPCFQQWELLAVLLGVLAPLGGGHLWLLQWRSEPTNTAALAVKQAVTSMFLDTIIDQCRKLFGLIDDQLVLLLSQQSSAVPTMSRFDYFCSSLRSIPAAELDDDRGKYSKVIKEVFAGIIRDQASRVLDSVDDGNESLTQLAGRVPVRFALEADTQQRLHFVSTITVSVARRERWYRRLRSVTLWLLPVTMVTFIAGSLTIVFCNVKAGYLGGLVLGGIGVLGFILSFSAVIAVQMIANSLLSQASRYTDGTGMDDDYAKWKVR